MPPTTITFKHRWLAFWRATSEKLATPRARRALIVSGAAALIVFIIKLKLGDLVDAGLTNTFHWLATQASLPIGLFALLGFSAIVVFVCIWVSGLTLAAYRETRPEPIPLETRGEAAIRLSPEEKNSIQEARVVWKIIGRDATRVIGEVLLWAHNFLLQQTPLAAHLETVGAELKTARSEFDTAVTDQAEVPLKDVTKRLIRLILTYQKAANVLRSCRIVYSTTLEDRRYSDRYVAWEAADREFIGALYKLGLRDDYPRLIDYIPEGPGV